MADLRALVVLALLAACVYDADHVCSPGQERDARGFCVAEAAKALGVACDTAGQACPDPRFAHCQVTQGTAGYCTRAGCAASADCPAGYACDTGARPPFCKRPPVGQGKTCGTNADCSGQEATFCDNMFLRQCLVEGCQPSPNSCHEGWTCCDLTARGLAKTLCVPLPKCPE